MSDSECIVQLVEHVSAGQVDSARVLIYDEGGEVVVRSVVELRNQPPECEGEAGGEEEQQE